MNTKKSDEADQESFTKAKTRGLVGLMLALAITLCAFEYTIWDPIEYGMQKIDNNLLEEEEVMEAPPEVIPPPPPPPPQPTIIEIVEDDEEIEEELEVEELEVEEDTEIEIIEAEEEEVVEEEIFTIVEDMPSFPGGEAEMYRYLGKTIKYPPMAKDAGITGIVYVGFVVDKKGSITEVKTKKGIGGGCDKEAERVVKNMPKWKAGKQRGKPVNVAYTIPIRFTLK